MSQSLDQCHLRYSKSNNADAGGDLIEACNLKVLQVDLPDKRALSFYFESRGEQEHALRLLLAQ